MEIDDLMRRFAELPGATVGHGPQHPRNPEPRLTEEVEHFLQMYPALGRDAGYVGFLYRYAGAGIDNEERYEIVDVFGFTDASGHICELEGPVVDNQGFLVFAQVIRHTIEDGRLLDTEEYDYAFDVQGNREPGVYWLCSKTSVPESMDPVTRACGFAPTGEDFLGWIARVVDGQGTAPPKLN
jgi:hypothetical protein